MTEFAAQADNTARAPDWLRWALPALAALALLAGTVLMLLPQEQHIVGSFAYEPLPLTIANPYAPAALPAQTVLGIGFAALGALTLAFLLGWKLATLRFAR